MQINEQISSQVVEACSRLDAIRRRQLHDKSLVYTSWPAEKVYVIERGYVRLVFPQPSGRYVTRMILGRGALFGDLPFTPDTFKSEELAVVSGPSCLIEIARAKMETISRRDGNFRQLLLNLLAVQMHFLDRRLQWQLRSPLKARIAMMLADMLCFAGGPCHHGHGRLVDVRLTHEELSEVAAAARPTVSAILEKLRDSSIISYTKSHICLIDINALRLVAES